MELDPRLTFFSSFSYFFCIKDIKFLHDNPTRGKMSLINIINYADKICGCMLQKAVKPSFDNMVESLKLSGVLFFMWFCLHSDSL